MGQAVNGPRKGEHLVSVPIEHTTWADWRKQHPQTKVSPVTPVSDTIMGALPMVTMTKMETSILRCPSEASQYHPKERVIGIENNGNFKAYPFVELSQNKSPH